MKPVIRTFPLLMILAACASPLDLFYKPGVSVDRMRNDTTNCEVKALNDAPVAQEIRQRPPVFVPGYPICNGYGHCWYRSGYWADGGVYSVDVNKDLRNRVLEQCMGDLGYAPVSIPQCSANVRNQVAPKETTTLPTLSATSCYVKNADGTYQIVSPQIASSEG